MTFIYDTMRQTHNILLLFCSVLAVATWYSSVPELPQGTKTTTKLTTFIKFIDGSLVDSDKNASIVQTLEQTNKVYVHYEDIPIQNVQWKPKQWLPKTDEGDQNVNPPDGDLLGP